MLRRRTENSVRPANQVQILFTEKMLQQLLPRDIQVPVDQEFEIPVFILQQEMRDKGIWVMKENEIGTEVVHRLSQKAGIGQGEALRGKGTLHPRTDNLNPVNIVNLILTAILKADDLLPGTGPEQSLHRIPCNLFGTATEGVIIFGNMQNTYF